MGATAVAIVRPKMLTFKMPRLNVLSPTMKVEVPLTTTQRVSSQRIHRNHTITTCPYINNIANVLSAETKWISKKTPYFTFNPTKMTVVFCYTTYRNKRELKITQSQADFPNRIYKYKIIKALTKNSTKGTSNSQRFLKYIYAPTSLLSSQARHQFWSLE